MRCRASTKARLKCKNSALPNKKYCRVHSKKFHFEELAVPIGSALIAVAFVPTVGAAITAGITAGITGTVIDSITTSKTRVFVSFDFHHDRKLKTLIINQSNDSRSNFDIIDTSLIEAAPEKTWEKKAEALIKKSDIILVITGEHTHKAHGVLKEIKIAKRHGKKIIQILGHQKKKCVPIKGAGRVYKWNWPNLTKLLN